MDGTWLMALFGVPLWKSPPAGRMDSWFWNILSSFLIFCPSGYKTQCSFHCQSPWIETGLKPLQNNLGECSRRTQVLPEPECWEVSWISWSIGWKVWKGLYVSKAPCTLVSVQSLCLSSLTYASSLSSLQFWVCLSPQIIKLGCPLIQWQVWASRPLLGSAHANQLGPAEGSSSINLASKDPRQESVCVCVCTKYYYTLVFS
jgi:hypothetical protein